MRQQIADSEYEITWQDRKVLADVEAGWQAPNRANGLRTYFTESGIRVVPRTDDPPAWDWSLTLVGWGRMGNPDSRSRSAPESIESETLVAAGQPRVDGGRIEYDRGGIVAWYVNDARGLEQGFTIACPGNHARPPRGADAPAAGRSRVGIDLALGGTLDPVISEDGQAIDFVTPSGVKVIHYAALVVHDAAGRALPARMEGFSAATSGRGGDEAWSFRSRGSRGIRIVFEDEGAIYPVTVDPLATTPAWVVEGNQIDARMGFAVATAGDVNGDGYSDVIVGSNTYDNGEPDEGRAFVYLGSPAGLSTTAAWAAESNQNGAELGWSVATAGDVNGDGYSDVVVGAIYYDNGQTNEGRAFLYRGSSAGLETSPAWTSEGNVQIAWFGVSVGSAGDVNGDGYSDVIIGAYGTNRAFVYYGSAAGLAAFPAWMAEVGSSEFGISVSTAGDVNGDGYSDVIVGADFYSNGQSQEGLAFAYYGSAAGLPVSPSWYTESNQANARYGSTVSTAGDVNGDGYSDVLVGSYQYVNGETSEGRAYLYRGSASGLSTTASWTVEGNQTGASTGFSVSTAGDVNGDGYADVIIGSAHWTNGENNEGKADLYNGSAAGLSTSPSWTAEGNKAGASLGWSVATAGDVNGDGYSDVIAGAPFYENGENSEGRAFAYLGSASGLATSPGWSVEGEEASALEGYSVASAGDVNGDGYSDVIVGIPLFDGGQSDEGRSYLYLGSSAGLSFTPAWTTESNNPGAQYGFSVGTAGDINGDGYSDVIVGAPYFVNGQLSEGKAYLYLGSVAGPSTTAAWTVESNQANASYGWSVGTAGDVNGDGYSDAIVGALSYTHGQLNEGGVFVYHGSPAGLPVSESWFGEGNQGGATFGHSVGTAGDVNGDGFSDVIIGAPFWDNGQSNEGRAYVYKGSPSGLEAPPVWTTESNQGDADYGRSVATAGDVNGDGYADVIVGAPEYDNSLTDEGRAEVFLGSAAGLATTASWVVDGNNAGAHFGRSVGTAGDVNGDGHADVIVGAYGYSNGEAGEGGAFVYHGSAAGLSAASAWRAENNQAGAQLGFSVASAGDVNGDGYADVVVGAPYTDDGIADRGFAYLYYGNAGRGLNLMPQQRRASNLAPIARWLASDAPDHFRLAALGRSPFGRGRVKLEWEVKPLGSLLTGGATHLSGSWSDSGTGGIVLNELVSDAAITAGAPLHWRARLRYKASTTPFEMGSRWITVPWGGWNESMLRAAFVSAGRVPDGVAGPPLLVTKVGGGQIRLDWSTSCNGGDTDYEVYEGTIAAAFTSHVPRLCSTSGARTATLAPSSGSRYYLVVPRNTTSEGSYGTRSSGAERPASTAACLRQTFGGCPVCSGGRSPGAMCDGNEDCPGVCTGAHTGTSCLTGSECTGTCQTNPQRSCTMNNQCRFCGGDHSVPCMGGTDCLVVGGPCNGDTCFGIGSCSNPPPGTCQLP